MIKTVLATFFLFFFFVTGTAVFAQDTAGSNLPKDVEAVVRAKQIRIQAKKKLYPGGRDEEPLQVQEQLPSPSRGNQSEAAAVEESDHD